MCRTVSIMHCVHPLFGFPFNPVIVEIRQVQRGYIMREGNNLVLLTMCLRNSEKLGPEMSHIKACLSNDRYVLDEIIPLIQVSVPQV